jgi:hypothetical protein
VIDGLDQEEDHQKEKQRYNFQNGQWEELTKPEDKPGKGGRFGGARKGGRRGGRLGGGVNPGGNVGAGN